MLQGPQGASEAAAREAAARACAVAAFGAYWLGEHLANGAMWVAARGDGLLQLGKACSSARCRACDDSLSGLSATVEGVGFCSQRCYQRAIARPTRKCDCGNSVYLAHDSSTDSYGGRCSCGAQVTWTPPNDFPTTNDRKETDD